MTEFAKGDLVARKSYGQDVIFKIHKIFRSNEGKDCADLKGLGVRLLADAPLEDLTKMSADEITKFKHDFMRQNTESLKRIFSRRQLDREKYLSRGAKKNIEFFEVPGQVLHLDGDPEYLELCMTTYKQLGIKAKGFRVAEEKQPQVIVNLLKEHMPDILVLTGHDALIASTKEYADLNNYRNSKYFVEAVKNARSYEKSKDDLIIFAGACQSHYEALLGAGANFASSPQRILIHAFDPVFVAEKLAFTPINKTISLNDIISSTITGFDGVGGVETRGKFRLGLPKSPY